MTSDPRLTKGEVIRWQGSPDPSVHFTRADSFLLPFSIVWLGFAVFWTVSVGNSPTAPRLMWLFGLLFVVMGVFFVVGRCFVKSARKRRTRYLLTDRRAIIVDPAGVHNINLGAGQRIVSTRGDRSHIDVVFGADLGPLASMPGMASLGMYANTGLDFFAAAGPGLPIAFYDVADVDGLEDALDTTARAE